MQKIVLFIEPKDDACLTPLNIGNLFMNRFAVEEDAASEVLKIFELGKTTVKISYSEFEEERNKIGMDLIIKINVYFISRFKSDKKRLFY